MENNQTILAKGCMKSDFKGLEATIDGEKVTYLDSAATTLKPTQMIAAVNRYYNGVSCNIHRGKHFAMEEVSDAYEQVRYQVARFIGCHGNEVVFTKNTTESINLIASGLTLEKSDVILVSENVHHSNLLPWINKGTVKTIPTLADGTVDMDAYKQLLATRPQVVALTHCSNVTGIHLDLGPLAGLAKDAGALVVVDAAQSIPHRPVSVTDSDVDFMCFSAHKMLGPTGLGVLYGKRECLESLSPAVLGGGMVDWVEYDQYQLRKIPHRFEAGTPNIAGVIGFGAALDYLSAVGMDNVFAHDQLLAKHLLAQAKKREYITVIQGENQSSRSALLSMTIDGMPELDDLSRYLSDSFGIIVRNGHLCAQPFIQSLTNSQVIRVSAYLYNTISDLDYFFKSLDEIVAFMTVNKPTEITL